MQGVTYFEQAAAGHAARPEHNCVMSDSNWYKGHTDSTTPLVE